MSPPRPVVPDDEEVHRADPDEWAWNESWYFSWIDLDGRAPGSGDHGRAPGSGDHGRAPGSGELDGPAGFFRVGLLPNQRRGILWCFVHVDGEWLGLSESRLDGRFFDTAGGLSIDRWALRFAWRPGSPLRDGRFTFEGDLLVRAGARAGDYVPVAIDLTYRATAAPVPTGTGTDERTSSYEASRFEQMLQASGTVTVDGRTHQVDAGAHRDRSWGPREWRHLFTLGDLQSRDRQLYFVGRSFPGVGMAFLREGEALHHLLVDDGSIDFDDEHRTFRHAHLHVARTDGDGFDVTMRPISTSVVFDMGTTVDPPERWLYYRTLVEAHADGWDGPCRGWFETSRYGT
jgi:hypothetical protein